MTFNATKSSTSGLHRASVKLSDGILENEYYLYVNLTKEIENEDGNNQPNEPNVNIVNKPTEDVNQDDSSDS